MKKAKILIVLLLISFSLIITLSDIALPSVNKLDDSTFSAKKCEITIETVSREPHSVYHPRERDRVRDYLEFRLRKLGAEPICLNYDSIVDRKGDYFDISNLYAVIEPTEGEAESYLLLMAHLDSRYPEVINGVEHVSLGAADNGYGIAVVLETARVLLNIRDKWKQGVKILFTDSEELNLDGIRETAAKETTVLEKVGLVINVDARGVKGPALMFETSEGNRKLIELYKHAKSPYAYSVTAAVYKILPNFTDFTHIKEEYPGLNFAVINNLNYYHTSLDNFDNISLKSVQHYGRQIVPVAKEYITNPLYSNSNYLKDSKDSVYFTIPLIGLLRMSKGIYLALKILSVALFVVLLYAYVLQRRFTVKNLITVLMINLLVLGLGAFAGHMTAILSARLSGVPYRFINLTFIKYEYTIVAVFMILYLLLFTAVYKRYLIYKKISGLSFIASGIITMLVLSVISYIIIGDSTLFFVPVLISILLFGVSLINRTKIAVLAGIMLFVMFTAPLIKSLIITLTIGSLSAIMVLTGLYIWLLYPFTDRFVRRNS